MGRKVSPCECGRNKMSRARLCWTCEVKERAKRPHLRLCACGLGRTPTPWHCACGLWTLSTDAQCTTCAKAKESIAA